jgi:Domain of unknown function (DUF4347)/FG-GAP-like repeat
VTTYSAQSIVFIDSRVANLQALLDGLQDGETAYVLDPNSDGVEQIADILAANNLAGLASVSILGHGESGEISLGSSSLTDSNLASHSNALAELGASLAPGGMIKLYGCDIAFGTTGQQFISDFSTFAGGAPVEASTQLVGSASQGGNWTLDASSAGTTPADGADAPFTSAALSSFQGVLVAAPITEIWSGVAGQPQIVHVDDNGTAPGINSTSLYLFNSNFHRPTGVELDPNFQKYFVLESGSGITTVPNSVLVGSLVQALDTPTASPTFTTITLDANSAKNFVPDFAIDTANHQIYFVDIVGFNTGTNEISKFERVNYDGTGLTTLATVATGSATGVVGFALDLVNHTAVFAVNSGGSISVTVTPASGFLYEATGLSSTATSVTMHSLTINGGSTLAASLGNFSQNGGVAIDPATHNVYFILDDGNAGTAGGLYKYSFTSSFAGSVSAVWQETSTTQPRLLSLAIDPTTSKWYGTSAASGQDEIWVGSLSGGAPTTFLTFSNASAAATEMSLDNVPTFSMTTVANATFTESSLNPAASNNPSISLITSATASDSDSPQLVSATVSVGSFFAGDTLSVSTTGTSLTSSYNSSTGKLVLSGLDSFAHYQTALATVQFGSTSDNPTDFGSDTSRVLSWVVNDGLITSAPQSSTVSVIGTNDAPTLASVASSAQYTEEGAGGTLSSSLSVVDVDDLNLTSATVKITGGSFAGDTDVLAATTTGTSITASYNSSTQTLLLTGTDTLAHYQTVLDSVNFTSGENPTNFGSNQTRVITWQVNDPSGTANGGVSTSGVSTTTLTVTYVNDAPTLTNVASPVSFTEGNAVTLSGAVSITDVDTLNLVSATVKIAGGTFAGDGDVLATSTTGTGITASYNTSTETLTLSGTDTLAHYQTVLDKITFSSGSNPDDYGSNKTRTVTWVLNDGGGTANGGVQLSSTVTSTVSITAINDPPALTNVATSASYTENAGAQATLSSALTVSDVDSLNIANATVKVVAGSFVGDGDVLSVNGVSNGNIALGSNTVTIAYNSTTETLTLSGTDTLAHYQTLLEEVGFNEPGIDNPTNYGSNPTRTVTWIVNDGSGSNNLSSLATTTVSITALNDAPTLTGTTGSVSFTENGASVVLSPSVTVADPDNLTLASATVSITGGSFAGDGDVLAANTAGTSITASYDSTNERLVLTGTDTLADYRTVLDTITFNSSSDNPTNYGSNPTRTVTWVLNDGSTSSAVSTAPTETITITAINDAPTLSSVAASAQYTEEGAAATLSSAVTVSDPDNLKLVGATVSIIGGTFAGDADVLATSTAGTSITASYNTTTETLTLSGSDTLANYQTVLDKITFSAAENPTNFGSNPTRTITWVLNDGSGSSNLSAAQTETITITNVNDAPTLTGTAASVSFTENGASVVLSPSVTVADPDNLNLVSATVSLAGSFAGDGDVLAANTAGSSIAASYDSTTEQLTLTGSDTLAHYRTVLDTITFTTASDNPTNYGSNPTRTVSWVLNDGSSSFNLSTAQTETINITAINDAPTLSGVATSLTVTPAVATTISPTLSVSDPDNLNLASATVSITGGTFANDGDVLGADTTGTSITASYDSTTERLVLTGSDSLANYKQVLDSVTFDATGADPTNGGSNLTRTLTWVVNDGGGSSNLSVAATTTITIQTGPAINPPASVNYTEEGGSITLAPSLVVSDSDGSTHLVSATVQITGGTFATDADVLAADTTGTLITASYDAVNERLVLTGSDTLANYQTVLDSVTFIADENPNNFGSDPTRTVVWTVVDDTGGSNATGHATSTINITNVNDAPTLAIGTTVASWVEETPATSLAPTATVTDADNLNLASATVQITGGTFAGDADVLATDTTGTSITASYNSSTETLTLTGSDSLANYQTVLDRVTFNAGENPTDFGSNPSRTLTWTLNDGSGSFSLSPATITTVNITNVNDAPTLSSVASTVGYTLSQTVTLSPATSVSDPDNLSLTGAVVSITSGSFASDGDVLAVDTTGTNITASYDSTSETLTLTGSDTLADYQTVLDRITFTTGADPSNSGSNPTRTVTWVVNDGADTSTAQTTTISVHAGPGIFVPASAAYTEEQGTETTLAPAAVTLNDTDGSTHLLSATVQITGGTFAADADLLQIGGFSNGTTGTSITFSYNAATETLTLTGSDTFANYQAALEEVAFSAQENPNNFGSDPTRTVTWTVVDDASSTGTATSTISITNVNDAPTLNATATTAQWTEEGANVTLSNNLTVIDPDNLKLANATISINGGTYVGDGDVLAANTAGTSITASYDSATETLTLSGSDTLAHYQTVLDSVTFNAAENPTNYGSNPTRSVQWVLNDGSGSFNLSFPHTTTVTITNVNDAPTLSNVTGSDSFTVGSTITLSPSNSISDADNLKLASATVAIASGSFASDGDVLATDTTGTLITASYDSSNQRLILTGSDTLADYQTVLDRVTFASGANPNNGNANPTRTVTWVVNDGAGSFNLSSAATTTINIAHEPPTLTSVAPTLSFTQGNTTTISPALTVTDFDSANLSSATVSITGGSFAGDGDVLSVSTAGTVITASYNAATETLTLTGTDTLAHYQSVLDSVKFSSGSDPTNHGSNPTRTLTWVVNDGNGSLGSSNVSTTTITITPLDNAPTLSTVATSANFTENGASVTLSGSASISDPDSTIITSATVSIAGGTFVGDNDVLGFDTTSTSITASYNSSTETLTLTGADTRAHYKSVLDSVTFNATGDNPTDYGSDPTRSVVWTVADDFNVHSAPATTTVSITAINDAPTLASVTSSVSFLEGSTIQLSPTTSVSDPDSLNIANATISITGGFLGDGDLLAANVAGTHITASYSAATETMVLTGSDPLATYQAVLDSITFSSGSDPTNAGSNPTRTVTWVINDGSGSNNLSNAPTELISITAINDPPALSGLSDISYTEEGAAVTLAGSASVSDPDNTTLANATVAIVGGTYAGDGDVLTFSTAGTSITASYNSSTETLTLTGSDSLAHYQSVLETITFAGRPENPNNYGSNPFRTVTWVLNDGSASNNLSTVQTTTITVNNVNDTPTLTNIPSTAQYTEEGTIPITLASAASLSDPDNLTFANATVAITGGTFVGDGDVLTADTTGTSITVSYDSTTEKLTLTGVDTTAHYAQVLDTVTFTTRLENPNNYGSNPTRTIVWTVNDGAASNNLVTSTTTVSITNINDAPALGNVPASANYTENTAAVTLAGSASVTDPDNLKLANATVKVTGGTFAGDGDQLAANVGGTNVTSSYNASTETLTLTGSDTLANYQQVLDSLTFVTTSDNPTNYGSNTTRTVTWLLNDGSGSFNLSTTQTETVSITALNDAPTLTSVVGVTSYTENAAPITVSPSITVSDPDNLNLANATVAISNSFAGDGDVLAVSTAGTSITASYNSTSETLTLSGSDTLAHYQQVLDSVAFSSTSDNPTNYGSNLSRVLTWTVNDGSASNGTNAPAFTTVVITAVNDAPTLSNVRGAVSFLPQHTLTISPATTVSDPDSFTLSNATVKITGGTFAGDGDVLAANVSGTSITSSYNAATETLTLTGSDTLAHYQQVLDSVTFSSGSNPSNGNLNRTRTVTWVVNDGSGSNNLSTTATTTITIGGARNDFDGDNKSDLVLQNVPFAGTPDVKVELLNGLAIAASGTIATPVGWAVAATGDFNNDNKADILLQHSSGLPQIWLMNGTSATSTITLPNPGSTWHAIATGDFNADGNTDILWQNTDGAAAIWELNGAGGFVGGGPLTPNPGTAWHVIGAGDVNGDGKADILWQNNDGTPAVWEMNGTSIIGGGLLVSPGSTWHAINLGDFNGDGKADILWQNADGQAAIWELNGTSVIGGGLVTPNPGASWHVIGPSDFNGDGLADIVWQNNDGTPAIWDMNGTTVIGGGVLPNPGATWHVKDDGPISSDPSQPPALHLSMPDTGIPASMFSAPDAADPTVPVPMTDRFAGLPAGAAGPPPDPAFSPPDPAFLPRYAAVWSEQLTAGGSGDPTWTRQLHAGTG